MFLKKSFSSDDDVLGVGVGVGVWAVTLMAATTANTSMPKRQRILLFLRMSLFLD
jgi:hypothetical protein